MVAVLPIVAKARMPATGAFIFGFICRSDALKNGKVPRAQSAAAHTAIKAYVVLFVSPADKNLSDAWWLFQNSGAFAESAVEHKRLSYAHM